MVIDLSSRLLHESEEGRIARHPSNSNSSRKRYAIFSLVTHVLPCKRRLALACTLRSSTRVLTSKFIIYILSLLNLLTSKSVHFQILSLPNPFTSKSVHFQIRSLPNPFASKSFHFQIRSLPNPFTSKSVRFQICSLQNSFTSKSFRFQICSLLNPLASAMIDCAFM